MRVCILDAWDAADPALVTSHWVAEQTRDVLRDHAAGFEVTVADDVDQAAIRVQLSAPHDGFVFIGHGREHVLYRQRDARGAPIPLITADEIALVRGRWFHAFACLSGNTLAFEAEERGVAAYLGYKIAVNVEWEPLQLPREVTARLRDLVTTATLQLALGERSTRTIRRAVRDAAVRLQQAVRTHQDALELKHLMGLNAFSRSLHKDLALQGTQVED